MNLLKPHNLTSTLHTGFLFGFCCLLALGQLQRIPITNSVALYGHDLLLMIWVTGTLFTTAQWRHRLVTLFKTRMGKIGLGLLLWVGLGWGIAFIRGQDILIPLLYLSRLLLYGVSVGQIYFLFRQRAFQLSSQHLLSLSYGLICLIAWFGFIQYLFLPDTRFLSILGWDDHYFRFISTLLDPSFTGLVLVIGLILGEKLRQTRSQWLLLPQIFLTAALALTYSRSSYLSFAVVTGLSLFWKLRKQTPSLTSFFKWFLVLCCWILLLPQTTGEGTNLARTASIQARSENIQTNMSLPLDEVIWGQGLYVTTEPVSQFVPDHSRIPDSWPVFIWQGTGVIGMGLIILLGILTVQSWQSQPEKLAIGGAIVTHGLFNASLTQPFVVLITGLALLSLEFESHG